MVRGIFLCKKHVLYVLSTQNNWKLKNSYWLVLTNNCTSEKQNKAKEKSTSSVSLSPTQNVILQQRVHLILLFARYSPTGSLLRGLRYLQSDNQMNNKNKVIDNIP